MDISVAFVPHPPVIIPEVGRGSEIVAKRTVDAMHQLGEIIGRMRPDTIIFTTPHGNSFSNGTCILYDNTLYGDFEDYGAAKVSFKKYVNLKLSKSIDEEFERNGYTSVLLDTPTAKMYGVKSELENGAMVAMYYIDQYYQDYDIVHITPGFTPLKENYALGKCIRKVVDTWGQKVLMVCSGDLSHALKSQGPYDFHPSGPVFDEKVKSAVQSGDPIPLMTLDSKFIEEAAQCGLRSFLMGFGYMDERGYSSKVISYEGPFGVGYLTGYLAEDGQVMPSVLDKLKAVEDLKYREKVSLEDDYVKLARKAIEYYVKYQRKLDFNKVKGEFSRDFIDEGTSNTAGVFVSIHSDGVLRGCIGTIEPTQHSVIEEVIYNAISACSQDPRFLPVKPHELKELDISVDVLMDPEVIGSKEELDVYKYGVIVEKGDRRGVLLPSIDGVNTVDEQVRIAMEKAGIADEKGMTIFRFKVIRHEIQ